MAETKWINQNGGNWNDAANWDNGVPDNTKNAVFDAASFAANGKTVTINATANMLNFDISAVGYTFTLSNAAYAFNVYGDLKDSVKRTNGFTSTGYLYFKGNSNIYSNGASQGWNRIYFDGVGATFTNQDDWNVGTSTIVFLNGNWSTNNKTIATQENITFVGGNSISINLGSSFFYTGSWVSFANLTIDSGASTIIITKYSANLNAYGTLNIVKFPDIYSLNIGGTLDINYMEMNYNANSNVANSFRIPISFTVNNEIKITGGNSIRNRILLYSDTIGVNRTITCNGSIVASNVDFRDITLAGTANRDLSAITGGSGDCGGNSGIIFTPSQTQYYKHLGGGTCYFKDSTKWYSDSALTIQGRVPLPQDDWFALAGSFNATTTFVADCPRIGRSMDLSAVNQNVTWSLANHIECYGNYILGNNITQSGNFINHVYGRGNYDIKAYGNSLYHLVINTPTGVINFISDIIIRRGYEARGGTINHNTSHIIASYLQWYGTTIFNLDESLVELNELNLATHIIDSNATITINRGNSTIYFNPVNRINDLIILSNSKTFNKVIFSGQHTGNFIISGNNTFNELIIDKGRKLQITGGSTQTISTTGKLIADGSPTEGITIGSTNTTPFNLVYAGTGYHQVNYCNISYCNATANRFYAGTNSTDGGNNTGWLFRNYLKKQVRIIKRLIRL